MKKSRNDNTVVQLLTKIKNQLKILVNKRIVWKRGRLIDWFDQTLFGRSTQNRSMSSPKKKGSDLEDKYFAWTAGEKDAKGKVKKVKRHLSSSDAYIRRQRISKAMKLDPELVKVLRKDIEREVQGGSVNVKFDTMKRMMGASKLIGLFQKRFHWWKAKAIFRWKYGHIDMLVHKLRRTTKKLENLEGDHSALKFVMIKLEEDLEDLTGVTDKTRKTNSRKLEETKASLDNLIVRVSNVIKRAEDKELKAQQSIAEIEGESASEYRLLKLNSVILSTQKRLWKIGLNIWKQEISDMKMSNRGEKIAVAHYYRKKTSNAFKLWSFDVQRRKKVNELFAQKRRKRCRELVHVWVEEKNYRQYVRKLFESIFASTRKHVIQETFQPWKHGVESARKGEEINQLKNQMRAYKLKQMVLSLKRNFRAVRKIAFLRWLDETREAALIHLKLKRAGAKLLFRNLSLALSSWKSLVQRRMTQRARMYRIANRLKTARLTNSLRKWSAVNNFLREDSAFYDSRNNALEKVLKKKLRTMAMLSMKEWKLWTAEDIRVKNALRKAAMRMKNRKAVQYWENWVDYVYQRRYERTQMTNILVRLSNSYYAKGFYTWVKRIKDEDGHYTFMKKMFSRMIHTKVLSGWQTWRGMVEERRTYENNLRRALVSWTKKSMATCFQNWKHTALTQKRESVLLARCGLKMMKRRISAAFVSWENFVDWRQGARKLLFRIFSRLHQDQVKLCKHGLSKWRLNVERDRVNRNHAVYVEKMKKLQLTKLVRKKDARNYKVAYSIWKEGVTAEKSHELNISRMLAKRNRRTTGKIFLEWLIVHEEVVRTNVILRRALGKLHKKSLSTTFFLWYEGAQEQITTRVMLRRFGRKMKQRFVLGAYNRWREYWQERLYAKALGWKVLSRLGKTKIFGAWRKWVMVVEEEKNAADHQRQLMVRVLSRLTNGKVASALASWKEQVEEYKRNMVIMARVAAKMQKRVINGAFCGWADSVAEIVENRIKVKRALMRMKMRVAASMFNSWIGMVEERKRLRGIVNRTMKRMINGKIAAGFSTWRRFTDSANQSRNVAASAAMKMLSPALNSAMSTWKSRVMTIKRHRAAIRKAAMKWSQRTLVRCFTAIAELCQEEKILRTKLGRAVNKIKHKEQSRALQSWTVYVHTKKRLMYMEKKAVRKWRRREMKKYLESWKEKVQLYLRRTQMVLRIALKTRKKLIVKGLAAWRYTVLGIRMGSKIVVESKKRLPEAMKRDSVTESGLQRYFLESGWDHNFVAEKLPVYDPKDDVHCTFAHTSVYKKHHEEIVALEEADRKLNKIKFPGQKFAPEKTDKSRLKQLKPKKEDSGKGVAAASGSPSNAVKRLRANSKGSQPDVAMGEDVLQFLTEALQEAEKNAAKVMQDNKQLRADFHLKEQLLGQKSMRKISQLEEMTRILNQELEEYQAKYDNTVVENKTNERELMEEIKHLENKLLDAEQTEENIMIEKAEAKMKESKMRKELILAQEKIRAFDEQADRKKAHEQNGGESIESLRGQLREAMEDMHEQNEVIHMLKHRMDEEEKGRLQAEAKYAKAKADTATEVETKLIYAREEFMALKKQMAALSKRLHDSRNTVGSMDQKQQLAEKKWDEENRRLLHDRNRLESQLQEMARMQRMSDLHKKELQERLALFEDPSHSHHHHHHRHHHNHHQHSQNGKKGAHGRPQTAGPMRRGKGGFSGGVETKSDGRTPKRGGKGRPQTAGPTRRGSKRSAIKRDDPVVKQLNW
jgi:hypothetical protein